LCFLLVGVFLGVWGGGGGGGGGWYLRQCYSYTAL